MLSTVIVVIVVIVFLGLFLFLKVMDNPRRIIVFVISFILLILMLCSLSLLDQGGRSDISEDKLFVDYTQTSSDFTAAMMLGRDKRLFVTAMCESGKLVLTVSQGNHKEDFDISNYYGEVDLNDFVSGRSVDVRLSNEEAKNFSVMVKPAEVK